MLSALICLDEINSLHSQMIALWHAEELRNPYTGFCHIVCQQLQFNYLLWHEEDKVRSPTASLKVVAEAKRNIDRYNQQRNDWMEKIDDAITEYLVNQNVTPVAGAQQNSESIGSIVDRLAILALRIYHLEELIQSKDASVEQREQAERRLAIAAEQHHDLTAAIRLLVEEIGQGRKRHKTYRQLKLYNNPLFNPFLTRDTPSDNPTVR